MENNRDILPTTSGESEEKFIVVENEESVSDAKDMPDTICINISNDFGIGEELEISSASSEEEQDIKVDCGPTTSVASWLTRNIVGISSPQMDSEVPINENESENASPHEIPQRRARRFERDTESLRIKVLIAATRRRVESYFNPPKP